MVRGSLVSQPSPCLDLGSKAQNDPAFIGIETSVLTYPQIRIGPKILLLYCVIGQGFSYHYPFGGTLCVTDLIIGNGIGDQS